MLFKKLTQFVFVSLFLSLSTLLPCIAYADGISWLETQVNTDGSYSNDSDLSFPTQSTAEVLRTYYALDENNQLGVISANSFLDAQGDDKTEILSRKIISIAEADGDTSTLVNKLVQLQNFNGGFGDQEGYNSRVLDTAFALNALGIAKSNNSDTINRAIAYLIAEQSSDGGFSHSSANNDSIYETALVSIALQHFRFNYNLSTVITEASEFILSNQEADGSWGSVWETSYAILALVPVTLDKDKYQAGLDSLTTLQLTNSSWDDDVYSTALALRAIFKAENVQNPQDPTEGIFTGQVIDNSNGQPIPGVEVSVTNLSDFVTTTLADGTFVLSGIPVGEHSILYNASGFSSASQSASTVAGQFTSLGTVQLTPLSNKGVLFGVVRDSETNQVLDAATISITGVTNTAVTTDGNGYFSVELDPGVIDIAISASGYDSVSANVDVSIGQRLNFSPLLNLTGTTPTITTVTTKIEVVDATTNQSLSDVIVSIVGTSISGTTGTDGKLVLEDIEPGSLNIEISLGGYQTLSANTLASAGNIIDLGVVRLSKIDLSDNRTLKGIVSDAVTGSPISGAQISIEGSSISVVSDTNGFYLIEDTEVSSFNVVANANGYLQNGGQVNIDDPGQITVNIQLGKALFEGINFESLSTNLIDYRAHELVTTKALLGNSSTVDKNVKVFGEVIDSSNTVISTFIFSPPDLNGSDTDSYPIVTDGDIYLEGQWFTGIQSSGIYQIRVSVFDESGSQLLTTNQVSINIEESQKLSLLKVKANPNITNLDALEVVELSGLLTNLSNINTNSEYQYSVLDPENEVIHTGVLGISVTPEEQTKLFIFDTFSHTFNKSGQYTIQFENISGVKIQNFMIETISVAPKTRVEIEQMIQPETITPGQDKRIQIKIQLQGVEEL